MLRSLISASVRFRFLVIAVAAGVMALAVATVPGIHADVLPETAPVTARIQTEAPGLSAPEVESLVTVPLEKNLLEGVMGVTDVTSDSIPGLSQINLHFAPGTNLYQARQLVQERLTQAFVLPNVSKPPVMLQPVSSTGNVMLIGLTSRQLSQIDLSVLARWTIVPRLLGVAGVADVSTFGEADRQLQVLVDPARLAARHITLAQIIETAGNAQLVSPLSYLEGSTPGTGGFLEGPNQRITIEPVLPFGTPANLGQVPVTVTRAPSRCRSAAWPTSWRAPAADRRRPGPWPARAGARDPEAAVRQRARRDRGAGPGAGSAGAQPVRRARQRLAVPPGHLYRQRAAQPQPGSDRRGGTRGAGTDRAAAEPPAGRRRADRHGDLADRWHRAAVPARVHVQRAGPARAAAGARGGRRRGRRAAAAPIPGDDPPRAPPLTGRCHPPVPPAPPTPLGRRGLPASCAARCAPRRWRRWRRSPRWPLSPG